MLNQFVKPLTWILGVVFLGAGIAGFLDADGLVLGLRVDTVHNIIHLATGVAALGTAAMGYGPARMFLIIFGVVYALVATLGFVLVPDEGELLNLVAVNTNDHYFHTVIAVLCLVTGFGSKKA